MMSPTTAVVVGGCNPASTIICVSFSVNTVSIGIPATVPPVIPVPPPLNPCKHGTAVQSQNMTMQVFLINTWIQSLQYEVNEHEKYAP